MKKTFLCRPLFFLLIISGIFCFANKTKADVIDFDNYETGTPARDIFTNAVHDLDSDTCIVNSSYATSGTKSLKCDSFGMFGFAPGTSSTAYLEFDVLHSGNSFGFTFIDGSNISNIQNDFSSGVWHHISFEVDSTLLYTYKIDGIEYATATPYGFGYWKYTYFHSDGDVWFDNFYFSENDYQPCQNYENYTSCVYGVQSIEDFELLIPNDRCNWNFTLDKCLDKGQDLVFPTSYGDSDFFPQFPIDGRMNLVSYDTSSISFTAYGYFSNASCATYNDIKANFFGSTGYSTSVSLGITSEPENCSLTSYGSMENYSVSVILPKDNYRVEYQASGYDETFEYVILNHYKRGTGVGYSNATSGLDWWGKASYAKCQTAYDDCIASSTSFLDRAVCGLQGVFWSLFCPSPETLAKSQSIVGSVKQKFPITLVTAFSNTLSSFSSGTASSTATSSLFRFDFSWTAKLRSNSTISDIRQILIWVLWAVIGFLVLLYTQKHFFNK